jgi:hypothetical protein
LQLNRFRFYSTAAVLVCLSSAGSAQDGSLSLSRVQFSGLVDMYGSKSFQNPASGLVPGRTFDQDTNTFNLNMAKLEIEHAAEPVGFRLDLGFGRGFEIFNGGEPYGSGLQYIPQAYVSVAPASWHGIQLDFGKFYTNAGAEPTETHLNWNYSRSRIYNHGPFFHAGVRAAFPVHEKVTLGTQLVNGWDNVRDNNTGKTVVLTSLVTPVEGFSWGQTYLTGPENTGTNEGWRNFYDTVVTVGSGKAQAYINFDYGRFKPLGGGTETIVALYGAARFEVNDWFAISPRVGWYDDRDGWATGQSQSIKDFTITAEARMKQGFIGRLEYRRDWSNQPYFDRGNEPGSSKNADTLLVGFVVVFGPGSFRTE